MLKDIDEALLSDHDDWLQRNVIGAGGCVAVYGAVDSGKTSLFKAVAGRQGAHGVHLRYWDLAPINRELGSSTGFWEGFAEVMGVESAGPLEKDQDVVEFVEMAILASPGEGPLLLVLDHWDLALDNPLGRIHAVSLDLLDSVVVDRHEHLEAGQREFRLVVLTGFPNVEAMCAWGRERDHAAEGLKALSKKLERRYHATAIPFLTLNTSRRILTAHGFRKAEALTLATATGGWLGLLAAAVKAHEEQVVVEAAITEEVQDLLSKAAFPALKHRWPPEGGEAGADWLSRVVRDIMEQPRADLKFAELALPFVIAEDGSAEPIQAIRGLMASPALLFVDLENVYLTDRDVTPAVRSRIILLVAERKGVHVHDIHIGTRGEKRAAQVLGSVYQPWNLHYSVLPESMKIAKRESGEKDNSDDSVLIGVISEKAARFPFASLHILSGDNDFWGALIPLMRRTNRVVQLALREGNNSFLKLNAAGWYLDDATYSAAKKEVERKQSYPAGADR